MRNNAGNDLQVGGNEMAATFDHLLYLCCFSHMPTTLYSRRRQRNIRIGSASMKPEGTALGCGGAAEAVQ